MKQSKKNIKNQYDNLINQAFSHIRQSNYRNAENYFKKAIKILDTKNVAYINLSNIYVAEHKIKKQQIFYLNILQSSHLMKM